MSKKRVFFFISVGALMLTTYIGPSFTAGTLLVSFFLTKGWVGMIFGPLVCALFAAGIYYVLFTFSRVYKPQHYLERTSSIFAVFGKKVQVFASIFHDVLTILSALVVISTMISTEASVLYETFGLSRLSVTLIFSGILIFLSIWGIEFIQKISSVCAAIMVIMLIVLAVFAVPKVFPDAVSYIKQGEAMTAHGGSVLGGWIVILSFCTNYQAAIDTVVPLASSLHTRKDVVLMVLVSTVPCYIFTAVMVFCYGAFMPEVLGMEIPCLTLVEHVFGVNIVFSIAYILFLTLAIITTCVSMLQLVTHRIVTSLHKTIISSYISDKMQRLYLSILIFCVCIFGSLFGIMALVNYGYMYMAQATLPFFILSSLGALYTIHKDQKNGKIPKPISKEYF